MTLRDQLDAAILAIYGQLTESAPGDWTDFTAYEPEDQGIVLRVGDAVLWTMHRETGLDARSAANVEALPAARERAAFRRGAELAREACANKVNEAWLYDLRTVRDVTNMRDEALAAVRATPLPEWTE